MLPVLPVPSDPRAERIERALKARLAGEVRFEYKSRLLYSTDASLYQVLPLGVVIPQTPEDVVAVHEIAAEHGVSLLPRGGGTSLAGQTVGQSIVLDFSKYMNQILEIDPVRRRARVQPGVKLERLQTAARPYGLWFGPDPATIRQCAVGGMIGNNSCGARSLIYGKTGDHVHTLDCILHDGRCAHFGAVAREQVATLAGREGELARALLQALEPHRAQIAERYPKIPRRVSGYNFDALLEKPQLNLADVIVGSEGTLATIVEAEIGLVPIPPRLGLVLLAYRGRFESFDSIPFILPEQGLSALEIVDSRVLEGARQIREFQATASVVPPDALGVLFCEFAADTEEEVAALANDFAARAPRLPGQPRAGVFLNPREQLAAWSLRQAATGMLYRTTPTKDIKPQEFVEDTGIPPEKLGAYTRRFEEIVAKNGTRTGYFGHAGQGCLHLRVDLNLKRGEDVRRMQQIAQEIAELVVEFGGSLSGEHGDGLSRSEFLPLMFGPEIIELHRRVKTIFDPQGRMNPGGKIVPPYQRMSENLRFGEEYRATIPETFFDYSEDGGWDRAVEKCSGMGVCRKVDAGTMCPSYMVLLEEEHATRGRANLLREAMTGALPGMQSTAVLEALDLCLACKACKTECPVGVDMARYKAEFLAQHYQAVGKTPVSAQMVGRIHDLAKLATALPGMPGVANLGSRLFAPFIKRAGHMDQRRDMPKFARVPFRRWWERKHTAPADADGRPTVILFDDTFYGFFVPEPLQAAVTVLERAGYRVVLPQRQVCCGRAAISKGLLPDARRYQQELVEVLTPQIEQGAAIVGLEPSCLLTLRDELPDLVRDSRAKQIAASAYLLEEFLLTLPDYQPGRLARKAVVHGHCHQKSLVGMGPTDRLLQRVAGLQYEILDSGCCGMAGAFGYDEGKYELSQAAAERVLMPAVRAAGEEALVVAPGFSCRHQIADFGEGRRALHPAELLAMAE